MIKRGLLLALLAGLPVAAFFAALFYCRHISVPALAGMDPAFTLYKDFSAAWPSAGP